MGLNSGGQEPIGDFCRKCQHPRGENDEKDHQFSGKSSDLYSISGTCRNGIISLVLDCADLSLAPS